jgi:hypothetical protein
MNVDANPAESSPAPTAPIAETPLEQAVASRDQSAFKAARRAELSGTKPETPNAASSAAAPVEDQAASTDATSEPASEPAAPSKPKKNADTRVQELLAERAADRAERAALQARLDALEQRLKPAEDKQPASSPQALTVDPSKPPMSVEDYFNAYPEHPYEDYVRYLGRYDRAVERAADERTSQQRQIDTTFAAVEKKAAEAYPDFGEKVSALLQAGVKFSPAINEVLLTHPQAHDLAYALVSDPDRLAQLTRLSPVQLGLALASLLPQTQPAAPEVSAASLTKASPPPTTLGRKTVDTTDPIESIVARGDMSAFKAQKARERLAQIGR